MSNFIEDAKQKYVDYIEDRLSGESESSPKDKMKAIAMLAIGWLIIVASTYQIVSIFRAFGA